MSQTDHTYYSSNFAKIYDPFMLSIEAFFLRRRRRRLLSTLEGNILEVGSGTGVNYPHYNPDRTQIIALEPSPSMLSRALKKLGRSFEKGDWQSNPPREKCDELDGNHSHICHIHSGVELEELDEIFNSHKFDYIVSTLVLCSVPDPKQTLTRFHSWLKPKGKLILLEHIRSSHALESKIQDIAAPLWSRVADGCQLNRPTNLMVEEAGFKLEKEEYFRVFIPFYEGIFANNLPGINTVSS